MVPFPAPVDLGILKRNAIASTKVLLIHICRASSIDTDILSMIINEHLVTMRTTFKLEPRMYDKHSTKTQTFWTEFNGKSGIYGLRHFGQSNSIKMMASMSALRRMSKFV